MKSIFLISMAILASVSMDAQKYLKVLEATSLSWAGGIPQSGTGTSYTIKAVLLTGHEISFSDAWTGSYYARPEAISFSHTDGRPLAKGDTILIRFTIHHYPPESPMQASLPAYKAPPVPVKGEALIRYNVGNSIKYLTIEKFKQLPPRNYM
jgi:hypothetical protein